MNDKITREIIRFADHYQRSKHVETRWLEPLVGFADAGDPLFPQLSIAVGETHALPGDLLNDALSVIAYFLPFEKNISAGNKGNYYASRQWAIAYIETNRLIVAMNEYLAGILKKHGAKAAVLPPTHNFDKQRLMSDWSHRHVAYIAGLGTFGLHNLLITDRGCCGRLGSIITDAACAATKRPELEYCLYKYNGSCTACVKNCVNGSLKEDSFDRHKCYALLCENEKIHEQYGRADACGKCTCGVPCSFVNPVKKHT